MNYIYNICNKYSTIQNIANENLNDKTKEILFDMYKNTYQSANIDVWFSNSSELFQKKYIGLLTFQNYFEHYLLYQINNANLIKISVICHNGTNKGKNNLIDFLELLLTNENGGFIIEASNAVSWLLRKRNVPIINNKLQIELCLGLGDKHNENDYIIINSNFNEKDKEKQNYWRYYTDIEIGKKYISYETMFGIFPFIN